ncbi:MULTISPECIES: hypothetical protein [Cupriavidus]|uniref:hypothetical protein n=1 Tax=Cupriavidus TaxID=106589 RepID=UPI00157AC589|nr:MULTISPECIES: hypothetical protein [Cupriavidus]MBB1634772.1 hypothetical protein [Cupriavidus sp. UME77]MCP3020310.1 hypothetical protein [Cupriavidus basilensis]MCY0857100.1 hypothetical protein [Cupriavidus sp. D39]MDW3684708.1 hypothetical protein [Cupriavidus sp. CV2]NUA27417.1 hypothetical protein [Cupriavidus basilensis]
MQTLLSVLALTILIVTVVGLVSPPFISNAFLKGRPVGRLQILLVGVFLAAICLMVVGTMASGGAAKA